ncbi:MAG TPA: GNAT family N-acetyltransferase [Flavobacteriales bacterium]|nr:GNAT family N-acetyltransferase [Flavobacteriales bacterium]
MIIKGYNITLKRLTHDDIELVRQWRNSQTVSRYMEIRDEISSQQQEEWFKKINTIEHNYYLIIENDIPVGLIYGSEIDWEKGITGNGGIFLCDEKHFHTDIPLRAAFAIIDTGIALGLKHQYVKVLRDNARAKFFNKKLGYEILPGEEKNLNQKYYLEAGHYMKCTRAFKKVMGFENEKVHLWFDDVASPVYRNIVKMHNRQDQQTRQMVVIHT